MSLGEAIGGMSENMTSDKPTTSENMTSDKPATSKKMESLFQRHMSRRQMLKGIGLAGTGALLAACGVGESGSTTTAAQGVTTTSQGVTTTSAIQSSAGPSNAIYGELYPSLPRGGSLVVGTTEQVPNTLSVLTNSLGATGWNAAPAQDWLEHYDHNSRLVPSLAESVEVIDDTTLRYTLRDAKFHTGEPVTSENVKDIFDWVLDEDNGSHLGPRFEGVEIQPEDASRFLFKLDEPNAVVRGNLPRLPIMPVEFAGDGEQSVGAGPFIFEGWERDSHVDYRSNPDYWNPEAPRVDSLRIRHFADSTSGTQTFLAGEMDYLYPASFPQYEILKQRVNDGDFQMTVTEPGYCYLAPNITRTPFDNPKVRQAVMYAMDREKMAQVGFGGPDGVGRELLFPVTPEHQFYPNDLSIGRDLEKARSLLAEAGLEGGFTATMISPDFTYFAAIATLSQQNLAEIGIEIDLAILDISTLIDRAFVQKDFDICVLGAALDPELGTVLEQRFKTGAGGNYYSYSNPAVDAALQRGRTTFDEAKRAAAYREVMQIAIVEDASVITVTNEPLINLYRNTTNGADYKPDPLAIWHWPVASTSAT